MSLIYELSEEIMQYLRSADMSCGVSVREICEHIKSDYEQTRAACNALEADKQIHISRSRGLDGKELHYIIDKVLT